MAQNNGTLGTARVNNGLVIEQVNFRILDENGELTKESLKMCLKPPYPWSYYLNCLTALIGAILLPLIYFGIIPTHQQGFFCKDPLFSHKYIGNTITPMILAIGEITLILNVLIIEAYFRVRSVKGIFTAASLAQSYYYLKYFGYGVCIVEGATEIAKGIVGEHRPDFFDVCRPDTNINCTRGDYLYSFTCTNTERFGTVDLVDASRSFPSGHSSISWFSAMYCAYIINTGVPAKVVGSMFKALLLGICVMWGMMCSLSRITDRRHHWWDVLFGAVIGLLGCMYMVNITKQRFNRIRRMHYDQNLNRRKYSQDVISVEHSNLV